MAETKVSLKLLIDTHGQRVLFAEAGKDFVYFLFHIHSLPVGTVIGLLRKQEMAGSLANLYQSIENLNDSYIQPNKTKDTFLKPIIHHPVSNYLLPLPAPSGNGAPPSTVKKTVYVCMCTRSFTSISHYYSDDPSATCPSCYCTMRTCLSYVAPPAPPPPPAANQASESNNIKDDHGFVKGVVTYMIMDDLVVTPLSAISSITLLNKLNIKDVSALEEKVVHLGKDEAVKLLNASLQSKKVLTDVFLSRA